MRRLMGLIRQYINQLVELYLMLITMRYLTAGRHIQHIETNIVRILQRLHVRLYSSLSKRFFWIYGVEYIQILGKIPLIGKWVALLRICVTSFCNSLLHFFRFKVGLGGWSNQHPLIWKTSLLTTVLRPVAALNLSLSNVRSFCF